MDTFHQRNFRVCSFRYFSVIRSHDMKEWCHFILISIPSKSDSFRPKLRKEVSRYHMIASRAM